MTDPREIPNVDRDLDRAHAREYDELPHPTGRVEYVGTRCPICGQERCVCPEDDDIDY
jgi:hypothetical protein